MNKAYLLTGGNQGNRVAHLSDAAESIQKLCGNILQKSSLYETAAWGKTDQSAFLNQALLLDSVLEAFSLIATLLEIEAKQGRKRGEKYGPRIIDIDLLFFNQEVWNEPNLKIPHPEIHNRRFALIPLNEIAPQLVHPLFHKTIGQLLEECKDPLDVKKFFI